MCSSYGKCSIFCQKCHRVLMVNCQYFVKNDLKIAKSAKKIDFLRYRFFDDFLNPKKDEKGTPGDWTWPSGGTESAVWIWCYYATICCYLLELILQCCYLLLHSRAWQSTADHSRAQQSTAEHITAQQSTRQSTAKHGRAQQSIAEHSRAQQSKAEHGKA